MTPQPRWKNTNWLRFASTQNEAWRSGYEAGKEDALKEETMDATPLDAERLGMAMDMVAEEDAELGVLGRGTGGERVAAKYAALRGQPSEPA